MTATHPSVFADVAALDEIDWTAWQPVERATLLFVADRLSPVDAAEPGAAPTAFAGGDRLLLIEKKRGLGQGLINGPGGRLEPGETARQAAIREVQEELGVTPMEPRWCGEHRFQFRDGYSMHVDIYVAEAWQGTPTETDEAVPLWTRCDAIPYERMWADDAHWIPLMLAGERFSGRYIFAGQAMLDFAIEILDPDAPPRA